MANRGDYEKYLCDFVVNIMRLQRGSKEKVLTNYAICWAFELTSHFQANRQANMIISLL